MPIWWYTHNGTVICYHIPATYTNILETKREIPKSEPLYFISFAIFRIYLQSFCYLIYAPIRWFVKLTNALRRCHGVLNNRRSAFSEADEIAMSLREKETVLRHWTEYWSRGCRETLIPGASRQPLRRLSRILALCLGWRRNQDH